MRPYTNSILSAALILSVGSLLGCDASKPIANKNPVAVATNTQSATYFVEGMVWGKSWTIAVEKQLKQLPGVAAVTTNMDEQTATVEYDPNVFDATKAIESFEGGRFRLSPYEGEIE